MTQVQVNPQAVECLPYQINLVSDDYSFNLANPGEDPLPVTYKSGWMNAFLYQLKRDDVSAVFVEGPKGAGKTAMTRFLSKFLDWNSYVPSIGYPKFDFSHGFLFLLDMINQYNGVKLVCDTSYISVLAYHTDVSSKTKTDQFKQFMLDTNSMILFIDVDVDDLEISKTNQMTQRMRHELARQRDLFCYYADKVDQWGILTDTYERSQKVLHDSP